MAEAPFSVSDEDSSLKLFSSSSSEDPQKEAFQSISDEDLVPSEKDYSNTNGNSIYKQIEQEISESLDQLSTKSDQNSDSDSDEQFRKRARVGNCYQARIPKYLSDASDYSGSSEDELLWDPFSIDSDRVEDFLRRMSSVTKLLIPMGNHLRDDEQALYILQKNRHDVERAFRVLSTNHRSGEEMGVWSEEECRNFEKGLLNFGKNFFLIQKYRVTTRHVGELVQFYYLWKKTERYDLFANRMRSGKKKYALNPGISDLMCRYLGRQVAQVANLETVSNDVQFIVKDGPQENSQY